jgi:ABC-2 type transport system ATP-binding protein
MKQKLAVARVLLHHPSLIFLDEPTAGLDPVAAAALRADLEKLVAYEGVTVFLTSHNLAEAEKLCDRVGVINKGRLIAEGRPQELLGDKDVTSLEIKGSGFNEAVLGSIRELPQVAEAELRDGSISVKIHRGASSAPIVKLLVGMDAEVEEVRKVTASLEESFLTLLKEEEN